MKEKQKEAEQGRSKYTSHQMPPTELNKAASRPASQPSPSPSQWQKFIKEAIAADVLA